MRLPKWVAITAALAWMVPAGPASAEKIALDIPNWLLGEVVGGVLGITMEKELGHNVEYVTADSAVIWAAIDKGQGIDVQVNVWIHQSHV